MAQGGLRYSQRRDEEDNHGANPSTSPRAGVERLLAVRGAPRWTFILGLVTVLSAGLPWLIIELFSGGGFAGVFVTLFAAVGAQYVPMVTCVLGLLVGFKGMLDSSPDARILTLSGFGLLMVWIVFQLIVPPPLDPSRVTPEMRDASVRALSGN